MGQKQTKAGVEGPAAAGAGEPEPTPNEAPEPLNVMTDFPGIDTDDEEMFPPAVIREFAYAMERFPPNQQFVFGMFDENTELLKWIRSAPSFFNYAPKRGKPKVLPKDSFMYALLELCGTPDLRDVFVANVLESQVEVILLAFSKRGQIIGFSLLGTDAVLEKNNKVTICFHEYLICTGPRKARLGAAIVKAIVEIAKSKGHNCVRLGATHAEEFHMKQGFVFTGRETLEGKEMILRIPQTGGKTRRRRR